MAKTSSETQRRKSRAARKGKWPPRGTETTVLTYPGSAPRGTGKAGENGQHSGEVGSSSAWTRPSAPECGDTLKALAGDQRPIKGGDRPRRRLRGRYRLGHRPAVLPPHGDGSMYTQANVRVECVLRPPSRALPSVIGDTEMVLREADGSVKLVVVRPHADGKVFAPECASKSLTVRAGEEPEERKRDEKTACIQARSSMARAMEINGKASEAEGKAKLV